MKRIWNLPQYPVYSVSTNNIDGKHNMNICTYAVPVSMKPKLYAVAVYHGTLTLENCKKNDAFVLQLLSTNNKKYLTPFGRKSGKDFDKHTIIKENSDILGGYATLKDCIGYMHMKILSWTPSGDHDLAICEVTEHKVMNPDHTILYWQQ